MLPDKIVMRHSVPRSLQELLPIKCLYIFITATNSHSTFLIENVMTS